ncbi:hypothetical protein N9948_00275 [bacterium]|nr:hypothetical protein [bacterium]
MSIEQDKKTAKLIQSRLVELGYDFKLGHAYEVLAALSGDKSWNVASTKSKPNVVTTTVSALVGLEKIQRVSKRINEPSEENSESFIVTLRNDAGSEDTELRMDANVFAPNIKKAIEIVKSYLNESDMSDEDNKLWECVWIDPGRSRISEIRPSDWQPNRGMNWLTENGEKGISVEDVPFRLSEIDGIEGKKYIFHMPEAQRHAEKFSPYLVIDGENGFRPTNLTWLASEVFTWEDAVAECKKRNNKNGIDNEEAIGIVLESMREDYKKNKKVW